MKLLIAFALALLLSPFVAAATEAVDLGRGLSYLRIRSLGDDTASLVAEKAGALVLDVRHASASDESLAAFVTALEARAKPGQLFVLVSESTPRSLAKAIEKSPAKFLLLGSPDARPTPSVAVQTTNSHDRAAYDAFESGTPIEKLITGKIEKERYDEATLVKEFKNGYVAPEAPAEDTPATKETAPAAEPAKAAPTAPPTDRVLQRAVHLHRALLSLRR